MMLINDNETKISMDQSKTLLIIASITISVPSIRTSGIDIIIKIIECVASTKLPLIEGKHSSSVAIGIAISCGVVVVGDIGVVLMWWGVHLGLIGVTGHLFEVGFFLFVEGLHGLVGGGGGDFLLALYLGTGLGFCLFGVLLGLVISWLLLLVCGGGSCLEFTFLILRWFLLIVLWLWL